jgi:hypothetical protein
MCGEPPSLFESHRRTRDPTFAERAAGAAERARDDEQVSGSCSTPSGNALGSADRRYSEEHLLGHARVSAQNRHTGLAEALVERDHIIEFGLARDG